METLASHSINDEYDTTRSSLVFPNTSLSLSPTMKPTLRNRYFSSYTVATFNYNDQTTPARTIEIPITPSSPSEPPPPSDAEARASSAAVKIQSAYRSHRIRALVRTISAVDAEADRFQRLIQRQETVDLIRREERERVRMNEALMSLLLRLDSVPGVDPAVRELRRGVSRRIVGLQEILDGVADSRTIGGVDEVVRIWEEMIAGIEEAAVRERGGGVEMERFCAEKLGFRCMERFLRGV